MPRVEINIDRCKGCETCVDACPQDILAMSKEINAKGYLFAQTVDPSRCIGCCYCAISCPDLAIEVFALGAQYVLFDY